MRPKMEAGVCEATGITFEFNVTGRHPFAPSIDRVDSGMGYTRENSRLVVLALNLMRGEWGDDLVKYVFQQWLKE